MEIVLATGNVGKVREFQTILRSLLSVMSLEFSSLRDYPSVEMPLEGADYEVNAREKALTLARALGKFALADDSGIEVEALGWRPGPYSARYVGDSSMCHATVSEKSVSQLSDVERVQCLLREMSGVPESKRHARYVCVAAFATPTDDAFVARGECAGELLNAPRGNSGFGYDPIFFAPEVGQTMAELPEMTKHRISHRGRALAALRDTILREMQRA